MVLIHFFDADYQNFQLLYKKKLCEKLNEWKEAQASVLTVYNKQMLFELKDSIQEISQQISELKKAINIYMYFQEKIYKFGKDLLIEFDTTVITTRMFFLHFPLLTFWLPLHRTTRNIFFEETG